MRKIVVIAITAIFAAALSICSGAVAFAYVSEADYELTAADFSTVNNVVNGEEGCFYNAYLGLEAYEKLTKVTYETVILSSSAFYVEVDGENNITLQKGQSLASDEPTTVKKEDFKYSGSKSKYYFTVKTPTVKRGDDDVYVNCAFVFTLYYNDIDGEKVVYGSRAGSNGEVRTNVLYCKMIDNSHPTASYQLEKYLNGKWVFLITVNGNGNSELWSANSAIKEIKIIKSLDEEYQKGTDTVIDTVKDVGFSQYLYRLYVNSDKATYFIITTDAVGNSTLSRLMTFKGIGDDSMESAVKNTLEKLKDDDHSDFSEKLGEDLEKAYQNYYIALQNSSEESEKAELKQACADIMGKIYGYEQLKKEGFADLNVKNYNTEFFGGEIGVSNSLATGLRYGDGSVMVISVAEYRLDIVNKSAEMSYLGIKKADYVIAVSLETEARGEKVVECSSPICLKIPVEFEKSYRLVQTASDGRDMQECDFTVANGYTEVYVPYASGTLDIFVGSGKNNLVYLWFLAIIPIAAAAIAVPLIIKKKKNVKEGEE